MNGEQKKTGLSPELKLLCTCARTNIRPSHIARIHSSVEQRIDWKHFLNVARQHRVMPLVRRALSIAGVLDKDDPAEVPDYVLTHFDQQFFDNLGRSLYMVDKLTRIIQLMTAKNIPVVPFKGPTLAASIYGDLSLRQFGDLDLLVHQKDIKRTEQVLIDSGYRACKSYSNEWNFENDDGKVKLDLHWGIYRDRHYHFNPASWWERCHVETLFDTPMSLFAPEDLLMVVCVNATKAYWDQSLRSICDIAELINRHPQLDWNYIAGEATKLRTEKMLLAGLWLAEEFLDAKLPSEFSRDSCQLRRNVDYFFATLNENLFQQPTERPDHDTRRRWDFQKMDRWQDRVGFLWRVNVAKLKPNKKDRDFMPLPRAFSFLHYLVRPIRLAADFCLKRRTD